MVIKEANIYPLRAELGEDSFGFAQGVHTKRTTVLVELRASSGETGIGESGVGDPIAISYRIKELVESVINREMTYNQIYDVLYAKVKYQEEGWISYSALSAIDIALNDLLSKELGLTVSDLYGGRLRASVPVYAGTGYFHPEDGGNLKFLSEQVERALDLHMKAVKIKVGGNIQKDLERIRTAQEIIQGKVPLIVDANQSYSKPNALKLARLIKDEVMFFEEPVHYRDLDTMRKIEELGVRVGAGESISELSDFVEYITEGNITVLEPDVTKVGGIKGLIRISAICNAFNRPMFPHNWSTQVSTSASVNAMLTVPSVANSHPYGPDEPLLEIDLAPNPLRQVFQEDYTMHNGAITPGKNKGLGLEINESQLKRYQLAEKLTIK